LSTIRTTLAGLLTVAVAALAPAAASAVTTTEFPLKAGIEPRGIVEGSDGNVWFASAAALGRVTPAGVINEFSQGLPAGADLNGELVLGSDGNIWFTDLGTKSLGRITPAGQIMEFNKGLLAGAAPGELTLGGDGAVWFLDHGAVAVGRIDASGAIKEFLYKDDPVANLEAITTGAEGNVWFTDKGNVPAIVRVTPEGVIKAFPDNINMLPMPADITAGPDGNLYFDETGSPEGIGQMTPQGSLRLLTEGLQPGVQPDALVPGPDGNVWFLDQLASSRAIGRILPDGHITEFTQGLSSALQDALAFGRDGNLWVPQEPGVARVSTAGLIQEFPDGVNPESGGDGDDIVEGADGNMWFNDKGTPKAIGRIRIGLSPVASTGAVGAVTASTAAVAGTVTPLGSATVAGFEFGTTQALGSSVQAVSLSAGVNAAPMTSTIAGLPSGTTIFFRAFATNADGSAHGAVQSFTTTGSKGGGGGGTPTLTKATFGNQQITLGTPAHGQCTARTSTLAVTLSSTAIPKSHATRLHFAAASFFLDKGVKHTRKRTVHAHGHKTTIIVVVFKPNATATHMPVNSHLRLTGLKSGTHTLKARVAYTKTIVRHSHHVRITVAKTLSAPFAVC
jgi:streptogramin lyase